MLTGEELGAAIASAIEKKKVKKKDVADFFGVKPPSVQDWIRRGTIDKAKLPALWQYFSDVVGPEHWGLTTLSIDSDPAEISLGQTLARLGQALERAQPQTRAAVADLLSRYAQDPAQGKSLAQAIEMLVQSDIDKKADA